MGVKDLVRALGDLCLRMYRAERDQAVRELRNLEAALPPKAREEVADAIKLLEGYIMDARWDAAFTTLQQIYEAAAKYLEDPTVSVWLPERTYERFEEVAEAVKEPKSRLGREIMTGQTSPVDVDHYWERIEEAAKPVKADWEARIEEALKPMEPEHIKRLKEYGLT